jgi:hypothetical protein
MTLLIREKRNELNLLQHEMQDALKFPGDRDYEYVALLYPLISGLEREIEKLEALAQRPDPSSDDGFEAHVRQFLSEPYQLMEIWVDIQDYYEPQSFCLLEIRKLKSKYTVSCTIRIEDNIERYLILDTTSSLFEKVGWHKVGRKMFRRKAVLKEATSLESFCQLMSVTMLDSFDGILEYGKRQYYRFRN